MEPSSSSRVPTSDTWTSTGSGLGTASLEPFFARGPRTSVLAGPSGDPTGLGAGAGAGEPALALTGFTAANTPLLTSCWTVSMAEAFPRRSVTPSWRRWEREWLARPLRFSNSSPQRMQVKTLAGAAAPEKNDRGRDFESTRIRPLFDVTSVISTFSDARPTV